MTPVGYDLTTAIVELKLDGGAYGRASTCCSGSTGPRTLMVTPAIDPGIRDAAHALLAADGGGVVVINDSPGFVAQRIVAHIINVGCQIAQRGSPRLPTSTRAPSSAWPIRTGRSRGATSSARSACCFILERLATFYGEPRYRPSPWLKRRAALGPVAVSHAEGRG